ncbi:MAG: hypothetical protein WBK55_08265 [Alphaproteobacteria bacterium]
MDAGSLNKVNVNTETLEISFELNGRAAVIKPTWRAISDIQNDLGYGMVPLAVRIQSKNFGLHELTTIILRGIIATRPQIKPKYEEIAEEVFKAGILSPVIIEATTKFCELALSGGKKAEGKLPAGAEKN